MPVRAVIFDLGNTLVYFDGPWSQVLSETNQELTQALKDFGFEVDAEKVGRLFGERMKAYRRSREDDLVEHSTAVILQNLLTDLGYSQIPEDILLQILARLYAVSQAHWLPEADAVSTVQALREKGYLLGVVSNAGDDADVQTLVDKVGIRRCLDFVVSSAAFGYRKPDTRIFQFVLDLWGLSPEQVAMVGDTLDADVLGGNRAGMYSVWITRRVKMDDDLHDLRKEIQPAAEVDSLAALVELLDGVE